MKNFDHLQLDGRLLQLLLTVMEERSVTRAAERLDMTQSAVSHALDKLRLIVDDPLFVKSGYLAHGAGRGAGPACAQPAGRDASLCQRRQF
jgi:molybdenum-dependent DNA-binding transcriptional regulator ModE